VPILVSQLSKRINMKTISIRHGLGPLQTTDSPRFDAFDTADALGEIVSDLESTGILEPIDLARVKTILLKYVGGSCATTNQLGVTRAGDAADAGRQAAAAVARNIAHNQSVATGYRDFWDKKNAEYQATIRR
jgi:hypothetical protein